MEGPDGSSAWLKKHGYPFAGELIPFGAAVIYKPTPVQDVAISKMEPSTRVGIFAAYKIEPGYKWGSERQTGKYLVWDLDAFLNVCLASDSPALKLARLRTPTTVCSVELPDGGWTFPLKLAYDQANYTLEGRKESVKYTHPLAF